MNRRHFLATGTATAGAALLPSLAPAPTAARRAGDLTILFQGDSITDAGRDRSVTDPNLARGLGSGYPLLVTAAVLAAHPERGLHCYNRGVSGNKVPDLEQRWASDTLALKPDVLSILIGVNDFWHKLGPQGYTGTVADYERQYAALLAETRSALPNVRVLVLEPFVLRCGAVDDRWFPEFDERRAAAARVAAQAHVTFVPLQHVFDELARRATPAFWAADGVHPTPAGHAVIAEHWRRAARL